MKNQPRYIPENSSEIKRDGVNAVVYTYTSRNGALCAIGYIANQSKRAFNYSYRTEQAREKHITQWLDTIAATQSLKAERKAERLSYAHTYNVGDVVYFSWGYDQTNIDWFQVVAVPSSRTVIVRPIKGQLVERNEYQMCGHTAPIKDAFKGEPMTKHVRPGDHITFASYGSGGKWDGHPMYCSWYA